jgi:hypothetical protein
MLGFESGIRVSEAYWPNDPWGVHEDQSIEAVHVWDPGGDCPILYPKEEGMASVSVWNFRRTEKLLEDEKRE